MRRRVRSAPAVPGALGRLALPDSASWIRIPAGLEGRCRLAIAERSRLTAGPDWTRPIAPDLASPVPVRLLSGKKGRSHVVATVEQLAALVRGRLVGDGSVSIHSARPVGEAGPGDITFIENERYAKMLRTSPASAAIVGPHFNVEPPDDRRPAGDRGRRPDRAPSSPSGPTSAGRRSPRWTGVHPQAWVAPTATIGADVAIYPFVYVGDEAVIGDGTTLHPGAVIGDRCQLGPGRASSTPTPSSIADVILGDRVEVHAGHRARRRRLRLSPGRRPARQDPPDRPRRGRRRRRDRRQLHDRPRDVRGDADRRGDEDRQPRHDRPQQPDRPAQPALRPGRASPGAARRATTWSWPARRGSRTRPRSATGVIVGAQAGVHRNIPGGQQVLGSPAIPVREQRRIFQMIARLPEMHRQLRELSAQVAAADGRPAARPRPTSDADEAPTCGRSDADPTRSRPGRRSTTGAIRRVLARPDVAGASPTRADAEPIGLLAGSGRFPILFAEAAQRQGLQVACVGIRYEAPEELRDLCDVVRDRRRLQARRDDPRLPPAGRRSRSSWRAR